jgi:hypothetical protein
MSPLTIHPCLIPVKKVIRSMFIQRLERYGIAVPSSLRDEDLNEKNDAWPLINQGHEIHPAAFVDMGQPYIRDRVAAPIVH